jgi:hypothetical protein
VTRLSVDVVREIVVEKSIFSCLRDVWISRPEKLAATFDQRLQRMRRRRKSAR